FSDSFVVSIKVLVIVLPDVQDDFSEELFEAFIRRNAVQVLDKILLKSLLWDELSFRALLLVMMIVGILHAFSAGSKTACKRPIAKAADGHSAQRKNWISAGPMSEARLAPVSLLTRSKQTLAYDRLESSLIAVAPNVDDSGVNRILESLLDKLSAGWLSLARPQSLLCEILCKRLVGIRSLSEFLKR